MLLSITRPLLRVLWKLPGLTVCPLLALGIIIGIFPAYGFRPECIPLLLFAIFLVITNFSDFLALFSGLMSDSYRDRGLLLTLSSAGVFIFTLWIAFYFRPPMETDLSTEGVKTIFLRGGELHVRIYGPAQQTEPARNPLHQPRPLLILLPPVAGSFIVSDEVCISLRNKGFTVLSYNRLYFDSPSFDQNGVPVRLGIPGLFRLLNAISQGLHNTTANAGGRELEESRKQDVVYILRELGENKTLLDQLDAFDKNMIFLVGYGAGGAALTSLTGEDYFITAYPQIRGIVSIEGPILSSLEGDPWPEPLLSPSEPIKNFIEQVKNNIGEKLPRKITHITEVPRPLVPVLFVVSDRVENEKNNRYETIRRTVSASRNAALVAAVPGAGPFDYSGSPKHYPIFSFLFRGTVHTDRNHNWPELTASLITNFAALILDNTAANFDIPETSAEAVPESPILTKTALDNNVYLKQGGVWKFPGVRSILQQ